MKKFFKVVLKVILFGVLLLIILFVVDVVKNAIRINKEQKTEYEVEFANDDRIYESKYGWQMKIPESWKRREYTFTKTEIFGASSKTPGESGWVYVAVEPAQRSKSVDSGNFISAFEEVFFEGEGKTQFPNAEYVQPPAEKTWNGYKSYEFLTDHDFGENRVRHFKRYLFPPESGEGWIVYSQTRVDEWEEFESVIMETINSFE